MKRVEDLVWVVRRILYFALIPLEVILLSNLGHLWGYKDLKAGSDLELNLSVEAEDLILQAGHYLTTIFVYPS